MLIFTYHILRQKSGALIKRRVGRRSKKAKLSEKRGFFSLWSEKIYKRNGRTEGAPPAHIRLKQN